jgi:hypothetical protein
MPVAHRTSLTGWVDLLTIASLKLILPIATSLTFLAGFTIAWLAKPVTAQVTAEPIPAPRMREERPAHATQRPASAKLAEFFQRMQEAGNDATNCKAVIAGLTVAEISKVLAEFQAHAGLFGLSSPDRFQLLELVKTWHSKAPEAALAWVQALPKPEDRKRLIREIAAGVAETDLDAALALLREQGSDEKWGVALPSELLQKAAAQGADKLVEVCQLGLSRGPCSGATTSVVYPDGFDFQRALDGLTEAKVAYGKDASYDSLPANLVEEWAKRAPQAAWDWLQQGKTLDFASKNDFFRGYAMVATPAEVGRFLVSRFDPAAEEYQRYDDVLFTIIGQPELLEGFLQAAPGERSAHLQGLLTRALALSGGYVDQGRALLLGRMTPEERVEVLRRNDGRGISDEKRDELTPVLRQLGHSEEEIRTLLHPRE